MVDQRMGATDQDLEQLITVFRLLADKTRLHILMLLAGGERNVTSLCDELSLPQPTVSHHLGLLRMNNLIGNRRDGKRIFYSLNGQMDEASRYALQVGTENFHVRLESKSPA
jgi:DNA-binding transcriptional ArsR family regulator